MLSSAISRRQFQQPGRDSRFERALGLRKSLHRVCTVVIATRNRPASLQECLEALSRQRCSFPFRVLVVDNAPSDRRTAELASRFDVDYLVEPRVGLSFARNAGVAAAEGEFLAFLDDDSVADPDWLEKLLAPFEGPQVMAVTGRVNAYYVADGKRVPAPWHHYDIGPDSKRIDRSQPEWFALANFHGSGVGANMAFRRRFFEEFDGFDERLGRGTGLQAFEESHAFFRLIEAGYSLAYTPDAIVQHPDSDYAPGIHPSKTSYMALLCFEHPKYLFKVLRYMLRRFLQIERSEVPVGGGSVFAWFAGPFHYLAMRMKAGGRRSSKPRRGDAAAAAPAARAEREQPSARQSF